MKKIGRSIGIISMIAICVIFGGCNSGSSTEKKLVGTWYEDENDAIELIFYKDGSYQHGNRSNQVNGDYKLVAEDKIKLKSAC